jgi:uncharacterized protein
MTEMATFGVELRAATDGDGRTLTGIAIPYGEITMHSPHPAAGGGERFAVGAFKRTVGHRAAGRLPKLFRNHQHDVAVGVATEMRDTDAGVVASWRMADTPAGNAALQEFREGVLDSLSIGFRAVRETMVDGVREIREAHLLEVSLVPLPAYAGAMVLSARGYDPTRVELPTRPDVDPDWVPRFGAHIW